ncbi:hypothetical protein [Thermoflavimicrobium dichotomicum]|uniref:Uncharacterized protein n=1 Tax=Thermoflavimicrobium dichotomicum TaxID=46223 RepID=A0A1I3UIV5_9BACL|nr:hypothetical protein [Thermoflavimicrobium dichotomicum]SFJ82629.1 hypothetical protein SAMN05421852_12514 [Thermoflavimicrobium dichotomicum]
MKGIRIVGFVDRGTLKFRVYRDGQLIGFMTLMGLLEWFEQIEEAHQLATGEQQA